MRFWSLKTLLAAGIGVIAAVALTVVLTAGGSDSDSDTAEIIAASQSYFDAVTAGDVPALAEVVCAQQMASVPEFPDRPEGQDGPAPRTLRTVAEIVVSGDTATGSLVIETPSQPELGFDLRAMTYVNEDGWKLCPSISKE